MIGETASRVRVCHEVVCMIKQRSTKYEKIGGSDSQSIKAGEDMGSMYRFRVSKTPFYNDICKGISNHTSNGQHRSVNHHFG